MTPMLCYFLIPTTSGRTGNFSLNRAPQLSGCSEFETDTTNPKTGPDRALLTGDPEQCWAATCIVGSVILQITPGIRELFYMVRPDRPTPVLEVQLNDMRTAIYCTRQLPSNPRLRSIWMQVPTLLHTCYRKLQVSVTVSAGCGSWTPRHWPLKGRRSKVQGLHTPEETCIGNSP